MNDALTQLLEPVVEAIGYELVLVEFISGGSAVLRVYIDAPGGIQLEDCEKVSREISALLDVEDPLPGAYHLEVSSPGLDRPLTRIAHFERFEGEDARVLLREARDGRRRFSGTIAGVTDDGGVRLSCEGEVVELALQDIEQARLVPRYTLNK